MFMRRKKFICFEMLEEGYKFENLLFLCFQVKKQGDKYVQNILFATICKAYSNSIGSILQLICDYHKTYELLT
jgi:hypothetical protein